MSRMPAPRPAVRPSLPAMLVAVLLVAAGCWVESAENAELERTSSEVRLESRVDSMLEQSAGAWNRGDLEGFMSVYLQSSETSYVGGSGLRTGYDAIHQRYAPLFREGASRDSLRFEELRVRSIDEDVAVGTARWVLHRDNRVTGSGPFTLVLRRVDGSWKIVHDHSSSDPGTAGDGEADGPGEEDQPGASGDGGAGP